MAPSTRQPVSNITAALAAKSALASNSRASEGANPGAGNPLTLPAVSSSSSTGRKAMLPTPPNSISPGLPPNHTRSPILTVNGGQPDSDIDLQDAVEHAQAQGHPLALSSAALSGLEAAGAITPGMLAKQHLPDILLANGPMAIRHLLGHLTHSVPGFSRIPPAKARRLVVGALESKTGGGTDGNVLFEKVGWGRWDARMRGQPPREGRGGVPESVTEGMSGLPLLGVSPPPSFAGSYAQSPGLHIPGSTRLGGDLSRHGVSWAGESMMSDDMMEEEDADMDMNVLEHEADKMSLDERDDSGISSCAAPEDMPITDDPEDATDDEDWAGIGAEALRRGSYNPPSTIQGSSKPARKNYNYLSMSSTSRMKHAPSLPRTISASLATTSMNPRNIPQQRHHSFAATSGYRASAGRSVPPSASCGFVALTAQEAQEREAVEALLRMGSM